MARRFVPVWILSRRVTSFQEFFELGGEESASPFLDIQGKKISKNLSFKSAILSAILLVLSFCLYRVFQEPFYVFPLACVYLLSGTPALISGVEDIFLRKNINIDVLMTIAAFGALALGGPFEGAFLLVLFALSGTLEDVVTLKAKRALSAINEIAPTKAYIVEEGGSLTEKAVHDVKVNEILAVRTGEIVPLDGIIIKGEASVSLAHLTGESKPQHVRQDFSISSGTKVQSGSIEVKVSCTSRDSTVSKLIELITRAHSSKPKLATIFDRFGKTYALSVIVLSTLIAIVLPLLFSFPFFGDTGSLFRAMSFLITASPCALILAVPITYLSSLGSIVRKGAVLKGSSIIDQLNTCTIIAFDKTGTLTEGKLSLEKIISLTSKSLKSQNEVLALSASIERHAIHPVALALVEAFLPQKKPFYDCVDINVIPGKEVSATINNKKCFIGGDDSSLSDTRIEEEKKRNNIVAILTIENDEKYLLSLSDHVRTESLPVIKKLHEQDKRVIMLTGDHISNAQNIATPLLIDEVHADLSPEDKLNLVISLSSQQGLLMVGDGINDAPALARATVSVSMGQLSSAMAREASDIILLHNDLSILPFLFTKAQTTKHIIYQNISIAALSILIGTTASLVGVLPLWVAVLIHEGSTLIVGLNALRLLRNPSLGY